MSRKTWLTASGSKTGIYLVRDEPQAVPLSKLAYRIELRFVQHNAGWIVGAREENCARARTDERFEVRQIRSKTLLCGLAGSHHACAGDFERRGVGRIHGIEGDHFIAGTGHAQRGDEQRVLRS